MILNWTIWLLLCGALQAIILVCIFFSKQGLRKGYVYLALYLVVLTLQILFKVGDKVWLIENMRAAYTISYYLPFLYGPLIWLFAKNMYGKSTPSIKDAAHALPFVAVCVFDSVIVNYWFITTAELISLGVYHFAANRIYTKQNMSVRWFRQMLVASFVTCAIISLLILFIYYTYPQHSYLRFGFVLLTFFIYWISYHAVKQPTLFSTEKYASSTLSGKEAERIENAILKMMQRKKLFTNADLTIDSLAAAVQTNRHSLSQVLNQRIGQSFYDFINSYRINEAKCLLKCNEHLKISSIAFDAGFNSVSAFNDVFKKTTGITPSAYRKSGDWNEATSLPA